MENEIIKEAVQEKKIILLDIPFYEKTFTYYADMMTGTSYYVFIIICAVVSLMQVWDFLHIAGLVFIAIWFGIAIIHFSVQLYYEHKYKNFKVYFITPGKRKVVNHEWTLYQLNFLNGLLVVGMLVFTFVIPFILSQSIVDGTGWASALIFLLFIPLAYGEKWYEEYFFPDKYLVVSTKRFNDLTVLLQ